MNSSGLQPNFVLFLEKKKEIKEPPTIPNGRLCCEKCRFSTRDTALFERHVAQHEEVTFSCTICNHISYSRVESQRHLVKHKGSFPYMCSWCSYGAVRRDYMVKHIQRIHGTSADGIIATDKMEGTRGKWLPAPSTLAGSSHGVKLVSHSAGTVSSFLSSASHTRPSAPYCFTSTTCGSPIIKPPQYIVSSNTHTVGKVSQGLVNTPNVAAREAAPAVSKSMEYVKKKDGKTFLENTAATGALSRVYVGVSGDRPVQKKPPLQSHVVGTTEKCQAKTMPKMQVGLSVSNNNHLKTLRNNQREAVVAQKSVISGAVQSIPVAQWSIQSSSNPTIPVERLRQEIQSTKHVAQTPRKNKTRPNILVRTPMAVKSSTKPSRDVGLLACLNQPSQHKRPLTVSGPKLRNPPGPSGSGSNVQELQAPLNQPHNRPLTVSCPEEKNAPWSSVQGELQAPLNQPSQHNRLLTVSGPEEKNAPWSSVQVELQAPLNQTSQHNRPLTVSVPDESNPLCSNVQVELLAPLNQPIQHNKPLTVSCPEEITIPAGCLVELVEVKTVNGTRELELRLVPQQLPGPQLKDLKSTTVTSASSRLSFKCKVTTDDHDQPADMNNKISTPKANPIPEHLVRRSHLKKLFEDGKVNVKNETDVDEKVVCSRENAAQAPGSSSKVFHAGSRPVVSNPSGSHKFTQQLCVTKESATSPVHCPIKNNSPHPSNKKSLQYKLTAAQPPTNKKDNAEFGCQGLPVISSVFSLCPIPQDTQSQFHIREEQAQISRVSGSEDIINSTDNPRVCRTTIKTEDETGRSTGFVLKAGQLAVKKDSFVEEPKVPDDTVNENLDTMMEKMNANYDTILPRLCRTSTDTLQTDILSNVNSLSASKSDNSTQPETTDKRKLGLEESLPAQSDGPYDAYMNPIVALIRMPSLEFFSLSESATKEKQDGEESITARPVICCTLNQQNVHERTIKLVLKRKRSEAKTAEGGGMDLVCVDLPPINKKAKMAKRRTKKHRSNKDQQLLGKGTLERMCLTPLKDDQLVKRPGPNQPVVVLNHPNPQVQMVSIEGQNNQHCRNSTPGICNPDGSILSNPVRACPAFKMTLKKVEGQAYQVTELLLKGLSIKNVL